METGNGPLIVRVAGIIGDGGAAEGRRLYDRIRPALAAGREVELDFAGVEAVTEPFLEAGFGRLLEDVPFDDLVHLLIVNSMTVRDVQALRYVLERARSADAGCCPLGGLPNP
jgi:hypothetical protein